MAPEYGNSGQCNRSAPPPHRELLKMPRPVNPDLTVDWKIPLPATIAGSVEHELMNPVTGKPRYGERAKLVAYLLAGWLETRGRKVEVDPPSDDLLPKETTQ